MRQASVLPLPTLPQGRQFKDNADGTCGKVGEKFWSEGGADALLQLSADYVSETDPLTTFWREQPNHATGQRHYQTAV